MPTDPMCLVSTQGQKRALIPWNWNCESLCGCWESSLHPERAFSALNHSSHSDTQTLYLLSCQATHSAHAVFHASLSLVITPGLVLSLLSSPFALTGKSHALGNSRISHPSESQFSKICQPLLSNPGGMVGECWPCPGHLELNLSFRVVAEPRASSSRSRAG